MGEKPALPHRLLTRLTAIKLASQMLAREAGLSERQRRLARTVVEAADGLAADLLDQQPAPPRQRGNAEGAAKHPLAPSRGVQAARHSARGRADL
jgi:hypothetical protein